MEQSFQDWHLAQDMLDEQIAGGLKEQFWTNVLPTSDSILCDLVASGIHQQSNNSYTVADSCRKDRAACHLPEFLRENTEKLRTITDYLASHPRSIKDQARVERLLAMVLIDPRAALGQAACWPLGDVIIILQVPPDAMVWSIDEDFRVLAEILALKQYPALKPKAEESHTHGHA